jgi:hypothetical protein
VFRNQSLRPQKKAWITRRKQGPSRKAAESGLEGVKAARASLIRHGYKTLSMGKGTGIVDIIAVRHDPLDRTRDALEIVLIQAKNATGKLKPEDIPRLKRAVTKVKRAGRITWNIAKRPKKQLKWRFRLKTPKEVQQAVS